MALITSYHVKQLNRSLRHVERCSDRIGVEFKVQDFRCGQLYVLHALL